MRLFVAIPLAAKVRDELSALCARLKPYGERLRWSASESWHITLQFLGNTREQQYDCILSGLRGLRAAPVPIALEGLGCFDRAGVFYAGVVVSPQLVALQTRVTAAMAPCGFAPGERDYHPHITLARAGRGERCALSNLKTKLHESGLSRFVAEEFCLYESFLGPGGSKYVVRERFTLAG